MPPRRILSLWFPRLAAERVVRAEPQLAELPLAVVAEARGALVLASLDAAGRGAGLRRGMALGDARAICPELVTRPGGPAAHRRLPGGAPPLGRPLLPLGRRGGRGAGARHHRLRAPLRRRGRARGADRGGGGGLRAVASGSGSPTRSGAAWALARFAGAGAAPAHAGDAIDQEARATRSRAQKRRWERGGAPPPPAARAAGPGRIVPPGETLAHIGALPVAALRLAPDEVEALQALGLRRIVDAGGAAARRSSPAGSGRTWCAGSTRRWGGCRSRSRRRGRRTSSPCA